MPRVVPTVKQLQRRLEVTLADMEAKMEAGDYHGVADCAMDAREIEAMLLVLTAHDSTLSE